MDHFPWLLPRIFSHVGVFCTVSEIGQYLRLWVKQLKEGEKNIPNFTMNRWYKHHQTPFPNAWFIAVLPTLSVQLVWGPDVHNMLPCQLIGRFPWVHFNRYSTERSPITHFIYDEISCLGAQILWPLSILHNKFII